MRLNFQQYCYKIFQSTANGVNLWQENALQHAEKVHQKSIDSNLSLPCLEEFHVKEMLSWQNPVTMEIAQVKDFISISCIFQLNQSRKNVLEYISNISFSACPEEKHAHCATYARVQPSLCQNDWFTSAESRYACAKSCGLC